MAARSSIKPMKERHTEPERNTRPLLPFCEFLAVCRLSGQWQSGFLQCDGSWVRLLLLLGLSAMLVLKGLEVGGWVPKSVVYLSNCPLGAIRQTNVGWIRAGERTEVC